MSNTSTKSPMIDSHAWTSKTSINVSRLFAEILVAIFVAKALLTVGLPIIAPDAQGIFEAVLDATMLALVAGPLVLWRSLAATKRLGMKGLHEISNRKSAITATAVVLISGIGISVFAACNTHASIKRDAQAQFDRIAERLTSEAQRRVNLPVYGLKGARGTYVASMVLERDEFRRYVASRDLKKEFPGVLGFGFIKHVMRKDLSAFIAAERSDNAPEFNVYTSGDALDLYVVKYIEPLSTNRAAWGWDEGSDPIRRAAIEHAIHTGEPTLSGRLALPQDTRRRPGFLYILPVYINSADPKTSEERESALAGLMYAPIVIEEVFSGIADAAEGKLDIEVFDGRELTAANLLLDVDGIPVAAAEHSAQSMYGGRMFHDTKRVNIGGREWTLALSTTSKFDAAVDRVTPALVGVGGVLLSTLLSAVVWFLGQSRHHALAMVRMAQEMNGQLRIAKDQAESMRDTVHAQALVIEVERERMELALKGGGLGTWEWNPQTDESHFDHRAALIVGEEHIDDDGVGWRGRVHPDDLADAVERVQAHFRGETPIYQSVHRMRHNNGTWRWTMSRGVVVSRDVEGRPTRMVGLTEDITERKELEQQLAQAQRLESLGELAAGIAHEINTPTQYVGDNIRFLQTHFSRLMQVLSKYEEISSRPDLSWQERQAEIVQIRESMDYEFLRVEIPPAINQSLEGMERVATIVRAMKDFSHPGSTTKEPADLNRSILSTIEVCRNRWKYVADVETDLADDLPAVPCLVAEVNQVLLNLIVNAADAIAEKTKTAGGEKGKIWISTRRVGDAIEIRVRDNGPGIPESVKPRIFEHFFTTKAVGKGTGQGLMLCRNVVVSRHGGRLHFESGEGKGTTFIAVLPLTESPPVKKQEAA